MNKPEQVSTGEREPTAPVFVSYATADRKQALSVCRALERRRVRCWISTRDVAPGENYQEAIVRSLRAARAMVLVFSDAANNSDEIKKELSLASRYHIPVMALRIEDVEPSDAFAYELSTRQWIDAFSGWDKSIDSLVRRLSALPGAASPATSPSPLLARSTANARHPVVIAVTVAALLTAAGAAWWLLRPAPAVAHSMMVRLTSFQRLSPNLPATLPDAVHDEIIAAFGDQGVVGVSTASAPPAGSAPAYALGGTIRRDGDQIRVIIRLTNERSGATLWSNSTNYAADQVARVPRRIAVDSARMSRCGLFASSTYRKALPDLVLADYMQYCQRVAVFQSDPERGLDYARRVATAAPDFSWGWSAVSDAAVQSVFTNAFNGRREEVWRIGREAADKALSLDPENSDALTQKSLLIDWNDRLSQEKLLKQAIAARPLDCGCEHLIHALMLENVGRYADAAQEFRRATDMLALDWISQLNLADALTVSGRQDEAKPHFDAAVDLSSAPDLSSKIPIIEAMEIGNYASGIKALGDPKLQMVAPVKAALLASYQAMASGNAEAKAQAIKALLSLPDGQKDDLVIRALAVLGDPHDALALFLKGIGSVWSWPSVLWYPSMRSVLDDPAIPGLLQQLGLINYWRTTHTRPDVCSARNTPAFCQLISKP